MKKKQISSFFIFLWFFSLSLSGAVNEQKVKGTVKDAKGETLIGVNVVIKGQNLGTITDVNGSFTIDVPNLDVVLVFSYVGYQTKEFGLSGRNNIVVSLVENNKQLDEVLVIGYGTQKKRDISTSIASISSDQLMNKPVSGFDQAIAGKLAGVRVSATNASPGAGQNLTIRGIGSISASSSPLYVVDGMPLADSFNKNENPLNFLSPADIESIEVLKDASASSIYGARASNGVVLVTTKRGKSGKATVSLNVSSGTQTMLRKVDVLSGEEFKQYISDSRAQSYVLQDPYLWDDNKRSWKWTDDTATRLANLAASPQNGKGYNLNAADGWKQKRWFTLNDFISNNQTNTDWQDEITQTGSIQDYQFSVNGGSDANSYVISANYFNQEGIVKNTGYERFAARANVDFKVNEWFKIGMNIAPSYETFDKLTESNIGNGMTGIVASSIALPPIWSPFNADGSPVINFGTYNDGPYNYDLSGEFTNPFLLMQETSKGKVYKTIASVFGEFSILKDLKFRTEFHTEYNSRIGEYFRPAYTEAISNTNVFSLGSDDRQTRLYWNTQNILTYTKQLEKHSLSAMLGSQAEKNEWHNSYMRKRYFVSNEITTMNGGSDIEKVGDVYSYKGASTMVGFFGRFMYNYDGKYYLSASLRRDASSKFGQDNKWGTFPSFSAAWRVSDESFMENFKSIITDWKIRGGWGKVGNSSIGDYLAYSLLRQSGMYQFGGSDKSVVFDGNISNSTLGWESTSDINIGTDIQFLGGRIGAEIDLFKRTTESMLFTVPTMLHTGFSNQQQNIAKMENKGLEFTLRTLNIKSKNFNWNTDFNISFVRNKVLDLGPERNPLWGSTGNPVDTRSDIGKPISNHWGYVSLGVYKDWEDVKNSPLMLSGTNQWERSIPGDAKYADLNGDGIIDANDKTVIGNPQPDFVWGMTNNFKYKDFDFSFQLNGVQGGDINLRMFRRNVFGGNLGQNNVPRFYFDNYWRPDKTDAIYEAPSRKNWARIFDTTTKNIEDGTYVNISNVVLGYTLPRVLSQKLGINNLRVYASAQNLYMFTKYHGYNPEANTFGNESKTQGADDGGYPLARTITLGLNFSF